MTEFDALIIGGGVAGCATAIELLSIGWSVALLHQPDRWSAIESISPAAARYLGRLSIQVGVDLSEVVAWWGSDPEARARQVGARIVQRSILADSLRERAIEWGAIAIESEKLLRIERLGDTWRLQCEQLDRGSRSRTAKYLIDATGRASVIGRRLGAQRHVLDQLFCISVSVHQPRLTGTWTESTSDGWWNLCCVPEEGTLSFYSSAGIIRESKMNMATCLYKTRHLRRLLPYSRFGKSKVRPCGSSQLIPCAGPGWLSVGDAAFTLQPLASAGVAKALRDARMVPQALENESAQYDDFQVGECRGYLQQLAQQYELEKRWFSSQFWESRHLETGSPLSSQVFKY
jgi:2-polyprenyl-6-methoxyphenol hydroxylase-like FAD-dependent oxidoreductase